VSHIPRRRGSLNLGLGHPLEGPLFVKGAEPGDALEVLVKWEIAERLARSEELPGAAVPEATFAGVVGVAPSHERMEE
jgi:formamidase